MKLPIDQMCATTGTLCAKCQRAVREGKVTKLEIDLSKLIIKTVGKNRKYRDITLKRAIRLKAAVLLIVGKNQKELWKDPNVGLLNAISDKFGTDVVVLEETKNPRRLVEMLISPATPKEITKVFIPPFGEEEYVIKIPKEQEKLLRFTPAELAEILKSVAGASAYVSFE